MLLFIWASVLMCISYIFKILLFPGIAQCTFFPNQDMSAEERCFCCHVLAALEAGAGILQEWRSGYAFCSLWGLGGGAPWGRGAAGEGVSGAWRDGSPAPRAQSPVDTHPRPWARPTPTWTRSPTPPGFLSPGPLSPAEGGLSRGPGHRRPCCGS